MQKILFPKKKIGDLGIYPASPSYSLTLTFIEATIFTVFNLEPLWLNVPRISEPTELEFKKRVGPGRGHLTYPGPYTQGQVRNHNDLGD